MGELITWIVPYRMAQKLPFDVDYSVMNTFCEFYQTLLKFINFKLFTGVGLEYPPVLSDEHEFNHTKIFEQ